MAEIVLRGIGKQFPDGTEAVRDISLTIANGEFFILLGPSGCGKSTLLNMIVGLESVSTGEVRIDGRLVNDLDPRQRNMAMVFQSYAIYPHLSVHQNLAFPLKLAKMNEQEIKRRVALAAEALELEALLDRMPRSLSGGQRQRVAMGRAMVREPDVFLLDEPLSNLDAKLRSQMRNEIAQLQQKLHTTMVYVTHDQTEAISLGHRLAVLHKGQLQQVGTPRELYNGPANLFVAGFLGSPAMNFFPGRLEEDRLHLPGMQQGLELPAIKDRPADGKVVVGLRPEHLLPAAGGGDEPLLRGSINMVEWLGADAYVHIQLKEDNDDYLFPPAPQMKQQIGQDGILKGVARFNPEQHLNQGEVIALKPDADRLHIFDRHRGIRLNEDAEGR